MDLKRLAFGILLSASLAGYGAGCGGDDDGTGPGGGDTPLGGSCTADADCADGVCEPSGGFCTVVGDAATGCTDSTCPSGFTCVSWGSSGDPVCDTCPGGAPRPLCIEQAGDCADGIGDGESNTYVLGVLNIGQADPAGDANIVPGFNLDGRVSDDMDQYGCYHPDFTSPPPDNEQGVDNQLGPILSSVGSSLDIEGTIQDNIAMGKLLILVTVSGIDDYTNDPCVNVSLELGTMQDTGSETPMLDAMGHITAGQTINVDDRSVGLVESKGEIVNGRLNAGPVDVELNLPIMGMELSLNIRQALLRFNIAADGIDNGLLGGSLDVDETVTAIVMVAPDSIPESLARSILEGQADLQPTYDAEVMALACQSVSIGLVYEGVPAIRGDEVTVATP